MVGALPSNRCETCRIRKVKCDQGWPVCGPCKRGKRVCPPRSALKIVDEGAQFQQFYRGEKKLASTTTTTSRKLNKPETQPQKDTVVFITNSSDESFPCRVDKIPPLSASERLSLGIINTVCIEAPSLSLRVIGEFIWQIPQLLGHSQALDSVVACMLASHKHLLFHGGSNPAGRINGQLYSRACHRLQIALNDSEEWGSLGTVYATVLMHRIEAAFGNLPNRAIAVHASGLTALLQKRGPPDINNQMELQVTIDCHLSIIQNAVSRREYCFLASDEWVNALDRPLDNPTYSSSLKMIYFRLIRLMACWPTVVREYAQLREARKGGGVTRIDDHLLLYKLGCTVLEGLKYIDHDLDRVIQSQNLLTTVPSCRPNDPLPLMFEVQDTMVGLAICHYAMITIVVCRILLWLLEQEYEPYVHISSTQYRQNSAKLQTEITTQCHRIWMLIEYSRRHKPLGLPVMQAALMFTVESAEDEPDMKRNIVEALEELGAFHLMENGAWREEQLVNIARSMRGEGPD